MWVPKLSCKGAFNNYVDRILPFWPPPCVDSFFTLSVDENKHFLTPLKLHAKKQECSFRMDLNLLRIAISLLLSPYIRLTCSFFVGLAVPFNFLQVVCKSICILMHEFDKVARGSQRPFLVLILLKPSFCQAAIVRKVIPILKF